MKVAPKQRKASFANADPPRSRGRLPGRGGSRIQAERVKLNIQARFNPIRGLTPELLARYLDNWQAGYLREAALAWDAMERRDLYLKNVASKRKKAVARLDWEIVTAEEADEAAAQAQRDALLFFYRNLRTTDVMNQNQRGGLGALIRQMMDAVGKGFAVHEIIWQPRKGGPADGGLSAQFRFVPLWFFENRTGRLRFLTSEYAVEGEDLEENGWLVTAGDGLMEATSVAYIYKHLPLKDWLAFSEKFGMPGLLGKTDAPKDSDDWDSLVDAVEAFGQDWAAVVNMDAVIETVEVKNTGASLPYPPLVEYMDRSIAALWRGADLSTISQGQEGVGASLQGDETDLLLQDDVMMIEETLNENLSRFVIRYTTGSDELLAYIKLRVPQKKNVAEDVAAIDCATRNGIPLGVDSTRERLGFPAPGPDEDVLESRQAASAGMADLANVSEATEKLIDNTLETLTGVEARWLGGVREDFDKLIRAALDKDVSDADFVRTIERAQKQMPELFSKLRPDELADALEATLGAAVANGAISGSLKRGTPARNRGRRDARRSAGRQPQNA